MKSNSFIRTIVAAAFCAITLSCMVLQPVALEPTPAIWYEVDTLEPAAVYPTAVPLSTAVLAPTAAPAPTTASVPSITGVTWDASRHFIAVGISPWPASWSKWTMYVDGTQIITTEATNGKLDLAPNAPLSAHPTGLFIATGPWPSSLAPTTFPCCGSLQFDVPGMGMTNAYSYNLRSAGCKTASAKVCTP